MSHSVVVSTSPNFVFVSLTIINYVTGGEAVSAQTDIGNGVKAIDGLFLGTVSPGQNSLGVPLFPILVAGNVKLFQFVSGAPVEIPPTTALNAVVPVIAHPSQY